MINKFKLVCIAIAGTLLGYSFAKILIPEISFLKYFAIEALITVLHVLFERAKFKLKII